VAITLGCRSNQAHTLVSGVQYRPVQDGWNLIRKEITMGISAIFLIIAIILFILQAIGITTRVSLGWIGMAFLAGSFLV
jgi:hypothetical protein